MNPKAKNALIHAGVFATGVCLGGGAMYYIEERANKKEIAEWEDCFDQISAEKEGTALAFEELCHQYYAIIGFCKASGIDLSGVCIEIPEEPENASESATEAFTGILEEDIPEEEPEEDETGIISASESDFECNTVAVPTSTYDYDMYEYEPEDPEEPAEYVETYSEKEFKRLYAKVAHSENPMEEGLQFIDQKYWGELEDIGFDCGNAIFFPDPETKRYCMLVDPDDGPIYILNEDDTLNSDFVAEFGVDMLLDPGVWESSDYPGFLYLRNWNSKTDWEIELAGKLERYNTGTEYVLRFEPESNKYNPDEWVY